MRLAVKPPRRSGGTFSSGDDLHFSAMVYSDADRSALLSFSMRDRLGNVVIHQCNDDEEFPLRLKHGLHEICVTVRDVRLRDGDYTLTARLNDELNLVHDRIGDAVVMTFDTRSREMRRSLGMFICPGLWSHEETRC